MLSSSLNISYELEMEKKGDAETYPVEYFNSLKPSNMPPHRLYLKTGLPIMLIVNLSPEEGLCNDMRLLCRGFTTNLIEAEIITGHHAGRIVYIPRITIYSSESEELPCRFSRHQFPVRVFFAMTINNSQALSRATSSENITIFFPPFSPNASQYDAELAFRETVAFPHNKRSGCKTAGEWRFMKANRVAQRLEFTENIPQTSNSLSIGLF
ncbi:hypothetical protein VTP01DRAFT_1891 [Rhizomucor pusillus]|uniref:uncharacterized protein n=1 Tax=Rhizomucor pusillus TaxID=4840 RepID=UPI00374301D4